MPNLREIPVKYIVDTATRQSDYPHALPFRTLIRDWFAQQGNESMGYGDLREIDTHFHVSSEKMKLQLDGCVVGRIRNDAYSANMLVGIIEELHRRMTIPKSSSQKARRAEDVRQDTWNWPLVMRVMIRETIIADNTNKATFGSLIEHILGNRVKANSIRRTTRGNYDIINKDKFQLSDTERDAYQEIFKLFIPLLKPKS